MDPIDIKFWVVMVLTTLLKWLLSAKATVKASMASALAGGMAGYYGPDFLISTFDLFEEPSRTFLIIFLVLSGETLARAVLLVTPEKIMAVFPLKKGS